MDSVMLQVLQTVLSSGFLSVRDFVSMRAVSKGCEAMVVRPDGKHLPLNLHLCLSGSVVLPDYMMHTNKRYHIRVFSYLSQAMLERICALPLHSLDLSYRNTVDSDMSRLCGLPLRSLILDYTDVTSVGMRYLVGAPLKTLSVAHCFIDGKGIRYLSGMPLRSLDLEGTIITNEDVKVFSDMQLVNLVLKCTGITDNALEYLPKSLRKLDLSECAITGTGLRYLSELPLQRLCLDGCLVSEGLEHLPETLHSLSLDECKRITYANLILPSSLKYLCLSSCNITDAALERLKDLPLNELDLSYCIRVNGEGLVHLRDTPLETLSLSSCSLDEENLRFLIETKITELLLDDTDMTDSGLVKYLSKMLHLIYLDVTDCPDVTDFGLNRLDSRVEVIHDSVY